MGVKKNKNNRLKNSTLFIQIFSAFVPSLLLCLVWFFKGKELAGGEAGIFFYTAKNNLNYLSYSWSEVIIGAHNAYTVAIQPLLRIIIFSNERLGIPSFLLQAILFFLTLFSVQVSSGYITKKIFNKISPLGIVSAQLFSILNLGALAFIWNRFQYPFIVFYALVPVSIAFIYLALNRGKKYVLVLNLILYIFAFALTSLPLLTLYWGFLFLLFVFLFFGREYKKGDVFLTFFIHFILWSGINYWWLYQFYLALQFSPFITSTAYSQSGNLSTLKSISQRLGDMSYLLRIMHKDFYKEVSGLWGMYEGPIFSLLSYFPLFFIFRTIFIRNKTPGLIFFLTLSVLILFFAKGSAGPFGFVFELLYSNIRLFESFRNPIEKFSLLLPIVYAPLFGIGLGTFYENLSKGKFSKGKKIFVSIYLSLVIGVLVFPMWTGQVFMSSFKPQDDIKIGYKIEVPAEYKNLNSFLRERDLKRLIVLPLGPEGVTYKWKYGYSGVEQSSNLLVTPAISFENGSEYIRDIIGLIQIVSSNYPEKLINLLPYLGADGVLVRSDIDWKYRSTGSPLRYNKKISNIPGFKNVYSDSIFDLYFPSMNSDVIGATNTYIVSDQILTPQSTAGILFGRESFPTIIQMPKFELLDQGIPIVSESDFQWESSGDIPILSTQEANRILPNSRYLPGDIRYQLMLLSEKISEPKDYTEVYAKLNQVNKRLSEMVRLLKLKDSKKASMAKNNYIKELEKFQDFINDKSKIPDKNTYNYIRHIFGAHKRIIYDLENDVVDLQLANIVLDSKKSLESFLVHTYQIPRYKFGDISNLGKERNIFVLTIKKSGIYSVYLDLNQNKFLDKDLSKLEHIQVDNKILTVKPHIEGTSMLIANLYLHEGIHEVQIPKHEGVNTLSPNQRHLNFDDKEKSINIGELEPYGEYVIEGQFNIQDGEGVEVRIIGQEKQNSREVSIIQKFLYEQNSKKINHYDNFHLVFSPQDAYDSYYLEFALMKNKSCDYSTIKDFWLCRLGLTQKIISNPKVDIRELSVKKVYNSKILAIKQTEKKSGISPTVSFEKIDPTRYKIHVSNAQGEFLISFLEKFHGGWSLKYAKDNKEIDENKHVLVNAYANGWLVDQEGNYDMVLEFLPEKIMNKHKRISEYIVLVTVLLIGFSIVKSASKKV